MATGVCSVGNKLSFIDAATDGVHVNLHNAVLEISHEKTGHNVVGGLPVNQARPVVVDKPAGDLIAILHVDAEVLLQMPVEKNRHLFLKYVHVKRKILQVHYECSVAGHSATHAYLVTFSACPFTYIVVCWFLRASSGSRFVTSYSTP